MADTTKALQAQVKVNEGKFKSVEEALVQQSIEDGVIRNFDRASPAQLDKLFRNRFFRYYTLDEVHEFTDIK